MKEFIEHISHIIQNGNYTDSLPSPCTVSEYLELQYLANSLADHNERAISLSLSNALLFDKKLKQHTAEDTLQLVEEFVLNKRREKWKHIKSL